MNKVVSRNNEIKIQGNRFNRVKKFFIHVFTLLLLGIHGFNPQILKREQNNFTKFYRKFDIKFQHIRVELKGNRSRLFTDTSKVSLGHTPLHYLPGSLIFSLSSELINTNLWKFKEFKTFWYTSALV